jgi:hypothetical protein
MELKFQSGAFVQQVETIWYECPAVGFPVEERIEEKYFIQLGGSLTSKWGSFVRRWLS